MKHLLRTLAVVFLVSFVNGLAAQEKQKEENPIVILPVVFNMTDLDESAYEFIGNSLEVILKEKATISEFQTYPHVLVAHCSSDQNSIGMDEEPTAEVELNLKLVLYDYMTNKSFGEKTIKLKGEGKEKNDAVQKALTPLIKKHKNEINSFVRQAYDSLMISYETNCDVALQNARELGDPPFPEDMLINLISVPAQAVSCKERANEELVEALMEYNTQKCNELELVLNNAIEAKDTENARSSYYKMACMTICESQVKSKAPEVSKLDIDANTIINDGNEVKITLDEVEPRLRHLKVAEFMGIIMEKELHSDPGLNVMRMEKLRPLFEPAPQGPTIGN
ncbi:MAG: hypothetical protein CL840_20685 [Crocinitomicaceae bacterium]|nr:hypothetical protein [Crocinitomicaceae bacterium]|tara:strand:- start:6246 stop:7256 length:1011 start_codon:yes stop_codon:yes gene_type:complete